MTTTCPCRGIPPEDPEVIGFQRDLADRILGVMWNCSWRSSHILPLKDPRCTATIIQKAFTADRAVLS